MRRMFVYCATLEITCNKEASDHTTGRHGASLEELLWGGDEGVLVWRKESGAVAVDRSVRCSYG